MNPRTSSDLPTERAERALFTVWPSLRGAVPWAPLGEYPTPVEPLEAVAARLGRSGAPLFVKRDDVSSTVYGGNKVRTLEALFGRAKAEGATRVWSTGAYGSNHALATVLHARRAGLEPGVILFPQPPSAVAAENLAATLSARPRVRALPHWSFLPLGMALTRRADRREGHVPFIMVPGGATPEGALGYVSAALELAQQVEDGALPAPHTVVVGVGSTCTSAGLLVGMHAAAALGIGWREAPRLLSVRVTPWPVTSARRIVGLARRTAALLARLTHEPRVDFDAPTLGSRLEVDRAQLGRGYGYPTEAGAEAIELVRDAQGEAHGQAHGHAHGSDAHTDPFTALDTTYAAKSFAAVVTRARRGLAGPLVYWATKSSAPLPPIDADARRAAPPGMARWLARAEALVGRD